MTSDKTNARVIDGSGKEKGSVELAPSVFQAQIKAELVHGTVRWQRAKKRAGTHDVLTRSEMKGGGKKPFKQKGTGNARAGSIISPLWVGGAVVHGPTPRSYEFRLSKKMRKGALQAALSAKAAEGAFVVVESMAQASGKTKDAVAMLKNAGVYGKKVLVVVPNENSDEKTKFSLGLRNIDRVTVVPVAGVNVYDLVNSTQVVCVQSAMAALEARAGNVSAA
ncbi:MAG: 50S ribosomal protein L4 [Pseudomonadota bacterium]|jgi:large subunit ribosomal protein L4